MNTETFSPVPLDTTGTPEIPSGKDPAAVGLRRILRRTTVESTGVALRPHAFAHFNTDEIESITAACGELQLVELERMVEDLREEMIVKAGLARQAVERAYEGGYCAGRRKGAEEARAAGETEHAITIGALRERTASVLNALENEKQAYFVSAENLLLDLSLRIAKKIIGAEPMLRDTAILPVLKKALMSIVERENLVVRVAPEDASIVSVNHDFWAPAGERLKGIAIEPDERIDKGGCIIESDGGIVDARPEVQMGEMTDIVDKAWEASVNND